MKYLKHIFICFFISAAFLTDAQEELTWKDLEDVKYTKDFDPDHNMVFYYPDFGENIKTKEGSEVYIKGFLVPIDMEDGLFALSLTPYKSCFFCGKSGPETVIQLNMSSKRRYLGLKMDAVLTFKGTLKLNSDNELDLIYILEDAEMYYGK